MMIVVVVFFSRFCRRKRRSIAEDPARVVYRKASSFTSVFPRAILLVGVFALPILKIHLHPRLLEHHAARRSTRDPQKNTTTKEEDRAPCSTSSFPSSRLGRTGSGRSLCSWAWAPPGRRATNPSLATRSHSSCTRSSRPSPNLWWTPTPSSGWIPGEFEPRTFYVFMRRLLRVTLSTTRNKRV